VTGSAACPSAAQMVISEGMSQVAEALRRPLRRVEYDKLVEAGLLRTARRGCRNGPNRKRIHAANHIALSAGSRPRPVHVNATKRSTLFQLRLFLPCALVHEQERSC
jgi:hypothetical protein